MLVEGTQGSRKVNASYVVDIGSRVNAGLETDCKGRVEKGELCFESLL